MSRQPSNQQRGGQQQSRQAGGQTDRARQQQQYQAAGQGNFAGMIREHMQVIGADNAALGSVDRIEGDRIKLARNPTTGKHGYLSIDNVQSVEGNNVRLRINANVAEKMASQA